MSHQVRGFSQPDRRVPQLLSHPLDVSNGSRGRRPLRSPPSDKKLQPLTGPMMARRSLNLLCNNLLGFLSISTCSVFSSERKHECETTTPCSNQTTALPTCLGLRVGEGMFSKLSSMSQLWLPEWLTTSGVRDGGGREGAQLRATVRYRARSQLQSGRQRSPEGCSRQAPDLQEGSLSTPESRHPRPCAHLKVKIKLGQSSR